MARRYLVGLVVAVLAAMGAQHRTTNFVVNAPNTQIAERIGQWAEHYRKEKALLWLGQEMPAWGQPCPLYVNVTMGAPSGATTFQFGQGAILSMKMEIQGPLDRLLHSVLPHEITHTVFAYRFRCPVPRWADEGGSVLSEDDQERENHDKLTRNILNRNQQIPMRRLFALTEYPHGQVHCLYAQGFSISDYLVKRSDRRAFLNFVGHGMSSGWDNAVQSFYGHRNVEELESAWLKHLRDSKRPPGQPPTGDLVARNEPKTSAIPTGRRVHLTVPPAQPFENSPVVRGAAPSMDERGQRFGDLPSTPPIVVPAPKAPPVGSGWQPAESPTPRGVTVRPVPPAGPPVQLGFPQFGSPPQAPAGASPIGFPR